MKNTQVFSAAVAVAVVVAVGGYGVYRLGMRQGMSALQMAASTSSGSATGTTGKQSSKQPLYWHDPMVPGQKFDKPGKSPFMDMPLVPVYGSDTDDGQVSVSPRVQQNLGVRTALVTSGKISGGLSAVGSVAYNERDVALVQARSNGFIERLYVRAPLDPVRKGQPLAELYVPDWIAAQEEFLAVRAMQGPGVATLVDGARQRMRLAGMTEEQVRLVASSGNVHSRLTLTAPRSGVITELGAREGMTVTAGTQLFRVNGLDTVWVNAEVPESVAAKVHPGDVVQAQASALPGRVFKGTVAALVPEVNASTRTLKARIELTNPDRQLMPGMFATLTFAAAGGADVLLVPSEAIIQTGTRSVVLLAQDGGKFMPVDVELGSESNGQTEVRTGLVSGQRIVVSGQFLIDSEASLKGTANRMGGTLPSKAEKSVPVHHGQGKVERIDKDEITISHGPIPTLKWRAMTMQFAMPPEGPQSEVEVGQIVAFDIKPREDGSFEITTISPVANMAAGSAKTASPAQRELKTRVAPAGEQP
ncbi:efflux RND transporter periplasmic adaptor subunit [Massilia sp. P8910]|uniref:efflux RND transporter periplasmic adaptor subunit n=1 Tax=Massilia antarctica TaxID=2765360 RepID=UPI001E2DD91A|nr:efflux RND transporter periplasmic adaptor subunit [Massilia antarctica]MCE3602834.1 efflux RND transporter periplasmic adaptor subunit [Massilia antarctica]